MVEGQVGVEEMRQTLIISTHVGWVAATCALAALALDEALGAAFLVAVGIRTRTGCCAGCGWELRGAGEDKEGKDGHGRPQLH
jgi:hypothetical protein